MPLDARQGAVMVFVNIFSSPTYHSYLRFTWVFREGVYPGTNRYSNVCILLFWVRGSGPVNRDSTEVYTVQAKNVPSFHSGPLPHFLPHFREPCSALDGVNQHKCKQSETPSPRPPYPSFLLAYDYIIWQWSLGDQKLEEISGRDNIPPEMFPYFWSTKISWIF